MKQTISEFIWNDADIKITVERDAVNGFDHFEFHSSRPTPVSDTGYQSHYQIYNSDWRMTEEEFITHIKEKLGDEPKQKSLF